jgi:predicted RNA-binding Zn-ribbon protein involved in translation (DUF1610 family)
MNYEKEALAIHVKMKPYDQLTEVRFKFRCPNCSKTHSARELCRNPFSVVGYRLKCGWVNVRMQWF